MMRIFRIGFQSVIPAKAVIQILTMRILRFFVLLFILHTSYFILPANAYWQPHVAYDIHVTLIVSIHTLDGTLKVVYTYNSHDTLNEVFFHLYTNAFQPVSLMDSR